MSISTPTLALEGVGPGLTPQQAQAIYRQGEEAVVFALLSLSGQLAQQRGLASPSTPSGMVPVYAKAAVRVRRARPPGRPVGHEGVRREIPARIDQTREHRAERCPDCGGPLTRCNQSRTRYTEDIPQDITPVVTAHVIHRGWCGRCRKPVVPDALPGAALGNRTLVLSAWLHYGLGNTLNQVIEVFNHHLQLKLTPGGLTQMWQRLGELLHPWYQQIQRQALDAAVLHADETGWRVNGQTHWLWCFAAGDLTYYRIDRSRGSPGLMKFFTEAFAGTLVSDFWGAYNAVRVVQENRLAPLLIHQAYYNMLGRWIEDDLLPHTRRHGLGVIAFCPLAQGQLLKGIPADSRAGSATGFLKPQHITDATLTKVRKLNEHAKARGQSLAQMALAWVLRLPGVTSALIGASKPSQVRENVDALKNASFTDEELKKLDAILA